MSRPARLLYGCVVAGIAACVATAAIALPKTPLSTVKCECECSVPTENPSVREITNKKFAAPGGDPNACGTLDGTKCRADGREGKLQKCEGVVERKTPRSDRLQGTPPAKQY